MNFAKVKQLSARLEARLFRSRSSGPRRAPRAASTPSARPALPLAFEPNPPGARAPGTLSAGVQQQPRALPERGRGSPRLLMIEAWGTRRSTSRTRRARSALMYDDLRLTRLGRTNKVPRHGDGQSYIQTIGVSADGQRIVSSVNGPAEPDWHTLVGPSGRRRRLRHVGRLRRLARLGHGRPASSGALHLARDVLLGSPASSPTSRRSRRTTRSSSR